ncbi:hypothetical protein D9M72_178060 [compost metagenome]
MPVVLLSPGARTPGRPPVWPSSLTTTVTVKAPFQSAGSAAPGASGSAIEMALMRLLICASVPVMVMLAPPKAPTVPPLPPTPLMTKPGGTDTVAVSTSVAAASWSVTVRPVSVTLPLPSSTVGLPAAMWAGSLIDDGNSVR